MDDMDFDAALLAVQQGKSDIVMAGVTVTEDRLAGYGLLPTATPPACRWSSSRKAPM